MALQLRSHWWEANLIYIKISVNLMLLLSSITQRWKLEFRNYLWVCDLMGGGRGATFSMFSPYVFFWSLPLSRNIFILFCFLTIIDQLELKCQVCLCVYWKIKWGETQELLCRSEWQISPFIKCILSKNYLMKFILSSPLSNTFGQVHLFKDTAWSNTIRRSHFFFLERTEPSHNLSWLYV